MNVQMYLFVCMDVCQFVCEEYLVDEKVNKRKKFIFLHISTICTCICIYIYVYICIHRVVCCWCCYCQFTQS